MSDNLVKVEDEKGLFRDISNHAILFDGSSEDLYLKRRGVLESHERDINNLKSEISEMKSNVSKILELLTELRGSR